MKLLLVAPAFRFLMCSLFCVILWTTDDALAQVNKGPGVGSAASGEFPPRVLVKPKRGTLNAGAAAQMRAATERAGAVLHERFPDLGGWEILDLKPGVDMESAVASLEASGMYEVVEKDQIWTISATPNDPKYLDGTLWGLHNTGQNGGVADADIDAPEGWAVRNSAPTVVVAVIDTGIRHTHQDLAANMWVNPGEIPGNGIDDDGNGYIDDVHGINAITNSGNPMDDNGHGTHCAGTIGGVGNNGTGMTGVAWNVKLMALKFLSASGSGTTSDAIKCINYARLKGADIMSNSWGGGGYSQALFDAIEAARAAGIIFVAAAGNESADNDATGSFPANYLLENVVSVAATTRTDALASFSNYGLGLVDLGAPGQDIYSTVSSSNSAYASYSGTSMATPHVSGVLALLRAQFPGDSARGLVNRMLSGLDAKGSLAGKTLTGGRLNLHKALTAPGAAPFNDSFSKPGVLAGSSIYIRSSIGEATLESGEPNHAQSLAAASVWWTWTAPASGTVSVDLAGSKFDTLLSVYTGSSLGSLFDVASNDDAGSGITTSRATFSAVAGTTYRIAVARKSGTSSAQGLILLRIASAPANDMFATPALLSGESVSVTSTNRGGSKEPGEPNHAGNAGGASVWFQWTAPSSGTFRTSTSGSGFDTLLGIYTGGAVNALTPVASNDNESGSVTTSLATFTAVAGTTYHIAVDGKNGAAGSVRLSLFKPAANDMFAQRAVLAGSNVTIAANNSGATKESGEPNHGGNAGGRSLWWSWTAASLGQVEINTIGSNFDTTLGVYTGTSVNALTTIASDDDSGGSLTSKVTFIPTPGQTYAIAVDGYAAASGTIVLNVRQTVVNSPPAVTGATVSPDTLAWLDQPVTITSVSTDDPEGDDVTLAFQWQSSSNGENFSDETGATDMGLAPHPSRSGKLWRCRIIPSDATASGEPYFTAPLRIDRRPVQLAAHGQTYAYDSDLFLRGTVADFPRDAILNEFSQGPSGRAAEWLEILFLQDADARGWTLRDTNSSSVVTFSNDAFWQNVPAGTLLVVYNASDKDPVLPPDDTSIADGNFLLVMRSNASGLMSGTWPGVSNSAADSMVLRDAGGTLVDGISTNGSTGYQPVLTNIGSAKSAHYNSDTEPGVELVGNWTVTSSAAGSVSPGAGNTVANSSFVAKLRAGEFNDPALFRFGASGDAVPGLAINPVTGEVSGTPDVPGGGFFRVVIERFTGSETAQFAFDLLVGSSSGVFTVPDGRTWTLNGPVRLDGSLLLAGGLETNGHSLEIRQTFASWKALHNDPGDDGDGRDLFAEYAFGFDPTRPDGFAHPAFTLDGGAVIITFRRQKEPTELRYILESSTDLRRWDPVGDADITWSSPTNLGLDTESVTAVIPAAPPSTRFYRVFAEPK